MCSFLLSIPPQFKVNIFCSVGARTAVDSTKCVTFLATNCSERYFSVSLYENPSYYNGGMKGVTKLSSIDICSSFTSPTVHLLFVQFLPVWFVFIGLKQANVSRVGKSHTLYLHLSMIYHMYINEESNSSDLLRCKLIFNNTWRGGKKILSHSSNWHSFSFYRATFAE